jgi:type VI secretion system protein ImpJ
MQNLPVHWYEGLFLRPQHFQAADRYWSENAHTSQQWDHPYHYGLHAVEFSREALANSQFEVHLLQARLRDGTLVNLERGQEPDRVDIKEAMVGLTEAMVSLEEAFSSEAVVRVYLAAPKLTLGRANVSSDESHDGARYVEATLPVQDESRGGDDQELQFKSLNVRLLLSTQDLSGYELLPIAQIKRAGGGEATPQIDEDYIPPVLSISAWPQLGRNYVRAIFDIIGQKIEVVSEQVKSRGIGLDSREPGDTERIMMLSQLNAAYGALGVLAFAQGVHPFTAYAELCRILGQLSIFSPERRVADIPPYDHEDLHRVFSQIRVRIEGLIKAVREYEYQQRYFVGVGLGLQVSLEPQWFHSDWQWYIGVNKGNLNRQECVELLSAGQLDWKLGSSRQVEYLFKSRAEGLRLTPVDRPIRALPTRQEWIYYEVPRSDSPAWRDVQESQSLAMRLKDSLILNYDRLQGQRKLVVSAQGRKVELEFALFAVPTQM